MRKALVLFLLMMIGPAQADGVEFLCEKPSCAEVDGVKFATALECDDPNDGCMNFILVIVNEAGKDVRIGWDKTYYLENRAKADPAGVVYKPVTDEEMPPGVSGYRIFPIKYATFTYKDKSWSHEQLPIGRHTTSLNFTINNKEYNWKTSFITNE